MNLRTDQENSLCQRKCTEKIINRASGTCGTITKDPAFVPSELQKDRRKSGGERVYEEIKAENPEFGKRHKPTDPRNLMNGNRMSPEQSILRHIKITILETKGKEKNLESRKKGYTT